MPTISDFTYTNGMDAVRAASFSFGNYTDSPSGYGFHYPDRDLSQCGGAGGQPVDSGAGGVTGGADSAVAGADAGETDAAGAGADAGVGSDAGADSGPDADGAANTGGSCAASGLTEDFTASNWHVVGRVDSFAAFAVGAVCGIDASSFLGIEFTIKGNAGTPSQLRVEVGYADDTQGSRDPAFPLFGTCDFGCVSPAATIPVTATETRIRLPWSAFHGGTPMDSVNPHAIINSINWQFLGGSATNAYDVDVTLDNLRFMTADAVDGSAD